MSEGRNPGDKSRDDIARSPLLVSSRDTETDRAFWRLSLILREIAEDSASDGQEEELPCQACAKDAQTGDSDEDGCYAIRR